MGIFSSEESIGYGNSQNNNIRESYSATESKKGSPVRSIHLKGDR